MKMKNETSEKRCPLFACEVG